MYSDRPNVFFIVLDTLRAKNTSVYGYGRETTPFLERFAEDSLKYKRAYAPAPWTTPSHASMFTGTYGVTHQTNRTKERLTPDLPTLAEILGQMGYRNVGFSNNAHVSPRFDFDRGFDTFEFNFESYNEPFDSTVSVSDIRDQTGEGPFHNQALNAVQYVRSNSGSLSKTTLNWLYRKLSEKDIISNQDRGAESTNQFVKQFLQSNDSKPFFMYLNYMEAHAPYQTPKKYQEKYTKSPTVTGWDDAQSEYFGIRVDNQERKIAELQDQYDGCIRYLDSKMEELLNIIKRYSGFEDTLIVITSDHGEAFGEKGLYEHKIGVYDELTHVPLLIKTPESETGTVERPVSNRWLFSTILNIAGADTPDHAIDEDVLNPTSKSVFIESEPLPYDSIELGGDIPKKFGLSHHGYIDTTEMVKAIQYESEGITELYPLGDERVNIIEENPDLTARIETKITELIEQNQIGVRSDADETFKIDKDTLEHLQELGYR